jgi:hypothetical protein
VGSCTSSQPETGDALAASLLGDWLSHNSFFYKKYLGEVQFYDFFSLKNKNVVRIVICFFLFLINLTFVVRYRLVSLCEATA